MRDKNVAGILALFLGGLGIHRFYLGQKGRGIVYLIFCWFPLIWIIALIDAISLLSMDPQRFDEKYNQGEQSANRRRETDFDRQPPQSYRQQRPQAPTERKEGAGKPSAGKSNLYKQSGLEKFKDFDYAGAIEDFEKSLEIAPHDVATHFNLACAYSLMEDAGKAFYHLDKAVRHGFRDFRRIKEHHALAFIRIHQDFEAFEQNQYRLMPKSLPDAEENLLNSQPDLLDQLKKLGELREKGLLTEREFAEQKKKLLG